MIDLSESLSDIITKLYNSSEWVEGSQLEFKEGTKSFPKDAWTTCSAFANSEGGLLIIGVKDNGDLSGLIEPLKIKKEFIDTINNKEKISPVQIREEDVLIKDIDGTVILAIRIVKAANEFKPVYLNNNESKCYKRLDSADQLCSEQARHQMIRDRVKSTQDLGIIPHSNLSDLDQETIAQYRNLMYNVDPNHP